MGYRLWSFIQTIFGLVLGWVLLDKAVNSLWISATLDGINSSWLSTDAVVAWLVIVIIIIHLIKSVTIKVRKE
ncbi:MAG: hypothetical protein ACTSQE_10405 [Candidatus Heimdallarchaeaceae archaeon]